MKNKKIKQFLKILTVLLFLFCFLPINSQTNFGNDQTNSEVELNSKENLNNQDVSRTPETQDEPIPVIDPITIIGNNVSQFNVSESIISQAPFEDPEHKQKTILDIDNENMTLEVPSGWDFDHEQVNISALYKSFLAAFSFSKTSSIDFSFSSLKFSIFSINFCFSCFEKDSDVERSCLILFIRISLFLFSGIYKV